MNIFNSRKALVKFLDRRAPGLMLTARYNWHVNIKGSMGYSRILKPIFERMGADRLRAIDVGANVGIYARFLSRHFRYCEAFEPLPTLSNALKLTASLNCKVHTAAVGEFDGNIKLRVPLTNNGDMMHALTTASESNNFNFFEHSGFTVIESRAVRLDSVLSDAGDLVFIKVDVEGYEHSVINGATLILERQRPILQIEIRKTHNPKYIELLEAMIKFDYRMFAMLENQLIEDGGSYIESQPNNLNISNEKSGEKPVWDYLFVPAEKVGTLIKL